jgi:hypothetical protein
MLWQLDSVCSWVFLYILFNCNWVANRWQLFSTHIHTNNTGNVTKPTSHRTKLNSVALVRERTIPTERPPPVGEVSANFCGSRGVTWSAQRVPTAVNLCFLDLEPLLFYSSSSSIDLTRLTRLSEPRSRPPENLVAPGIEPGTSVSVARNSDH